MVTSTGIGRCGRTASVAGAARTMRGTCGIRASLPKNAGHWRHVVRYIRARPDLTAAELDPVANA